MTQLTLVLFVDALRRDYPSRMPFLRALAATSTTGALREDVGFMPHPAYFGGLSPSAYGFTNMFCRDPDASPFGMARGIDARALACDGNEEAAVRNWLEDEARKRVPAFAATYVTTAQIPIELVANFDLVEKYAPWDPRAGYATVFDRMRQRGLPYEVWAWPETNRLADRSDRGLVDDMLRKVRPPCRFALLHLQELDGIGHAFGPESAELHRALGATDALLATLVGALEERFDVVDLILFGDHGMVSVTGVVDVWTALRSAPVAVGDDYMFFLDSTMARFWFTHAGARPHVIAALEGLPGHVLDNAELAELDLAGCDPRNGELIFLADPGVLISPNFFQLRGPLVRGMHGYHPDCPDNQGFFLVRDGGAAGTGDAGIVRPTRVHEEILRLMGLHRSIGQSGNRSIEEPSINRHRDIDNRHRDIDNRHRGIDHLHRGIWSSAGGFTLHPDPAAHVVVEAHMGEIVDAVRRAVPATAAVILTGSFGRGEGGVARDADGRFYPVNDYDVLLIAPHDHGADLDALGRSLAARFHTDFVHFGVWPAVDPALPLTLAHYDIRYGSRVLWGDAHALDALSAYSAADIPALEATQLLFNRLAGLLTGLRAPFGGAAGYAGDGERYLVNQTMKALMALGDYRLIKWRAYDCSYRARMERLAWLAAGARIADDERDAMLDAYRFKLWPDYAAVGDVATLAEQTSVWLLAALAGSIDSVEAYYADTTRDRGWVAGDNAWCADILAARSTVPALASPDGSIRQSIYASFPFLMAAAHGDQPSFINATRRLGACLAGPWPSDLTPANWNLVRERAMHAWLTLVH